MLSVLPLGPSSGLYSADLAAPRHGDGIWKVQAALSWWCQEAWAEGCPGASIHPLGPEVALCFPMEL